MNHEYTIYYIFLQCRYTTWWLKSIHSLVFCRKILLHSFLPTCCPGRLSGTSRDCATQCRFSDVSKSWGSRWRFREKGISVMLPGSMLLCGIFLGIWLNIYVIHLYEGNYVDIFNLGNSCLFTHPRLARVISIGKELLDALLEHSELRNLSVVSCCLMLPPVCNPGCQSCSYLFVTYWMAQPRKGPKAFRKGKDMHTSITWSLEHGRCIILPCFPIFFSQFVWGTYLLHPFACLCHTSFQRVQLLNLLMIGFRGCPTTSTSCR